MHLFTKTNSNLCVYSKYNQNPSLIVHQKTSEEEKQNNILKILSKTQKILTLQLKKYTNSFFSKILRQKNFKILFIRKQSFKSSKIIIKKKVQKDFFVLSLQQIYSKKHMNITHQTTEHPLYYNLLKVCLFVFPQFSHNETVYKLK